MSAFTGHLPVEEGEDFVKAWTWKVGGVVQDLTGASAVLEFRRRPNEPALLSVTMSPVSGAYVLTGDATGMVGWFIPKAVSDAKLTGDGVFHMIYTFSNGRVRKIMKGTFGQKEDI